MCHIVLALVLLDNFFLGKWFAFFFFLSFSFKPGTSCYQWQHTEQNIGDRIKILLLLKEKFSEEYFGELK